MASIFVTGSSDGIGRQTAAELLAGGHRVVAHARNERRAAETRRALPGIAEVLVGDLSSLAETRSLAAAADAAGPFDTVVHNAGIGSGDAVRRELTADGIERLFQVNVVAPYLLTALMARPKRLVYLSSGLHENGEVDLDDLQRERRPWSGGQAYCDSKLADVLLAFAVARRYRDVAVNAVDPGWIRTRMGGPSAPDPLSLGAETQVWLAVGDEPAATASGRYLKRRRELRAKAPAYDVALQEGLIEALATLSGVRLAD